MCLSKKRRCSEVTEAGLDMVEAVRSKAYAPSMVLRRSCVPCDRARHVGSKINMATPSCQDLQAASA